MLSEKKKKIYIGIIIFCVIGIFVVLVLNGSSGSGEISLDPNDPSQFVPTAESGLGDESPGVLRSSEGQVYSPPGVFPSDGNFDLSIFESSTFKALSPTGDITLDDDELGKENPFK